MISYNHYIKKDYTKKKVSDRRMKLTVRDKIPVIRPVLMARAR